MNEEILRLLQIHQLLLQYPKMKNTRARVEARLDELDAAQVPKAVPAEPEAPEIERRI